MSQQGRRQTFRLIFWMVFCSVSMQRVKSLMLVLTMATWVSSRGQMTLLVTIPLENSKTMPGRRSRPSTPSPVSLYLVIRPLPVAQAGDGSRPLSGNTVEDFLDNAAIDANGDGLNLDGRPFANAIDPEVDDSQIDLYATEIEEVRTLGALEGTGLTDVIRTQDQTDIAIFWSFDRSDTFRPYGHLHQIAQEAAFRQDADLADSARILGLTGIALADAGITAWNQKYAETQPRPEDVISGDRQGTAIADLDGLDETIADADWQPLLLDPPFPDYLSGHSTFGGAFGSVLDTLFPEATDIQVVSQDIVPGNGIFETTNDSLFNIDDFGPVRTFDSYADVGAEDAVSRVFAGVHVLESTSDAAAVGGDIGTFVAENLLAPIV